MLFASDLDKTLIHSKMKLTPRDVCVEIHKGRELSFMTPCAARTLAEVAEKCVFLPVTTRSAEQYSRLNLPVSPRAALVSNGAVLLKNGAPDREWAARTESLLKNCADGIERARAALESDENAYDLRFVDEAFIFAKTHDISATLGVLEKITDSRFTLYAAPEYGKVYVIPKVLNKGDALRRYVEIYGSRPVICAGDSSLDASMLEFADFAITPEGLSVSAKKHIKHSGKDNFFEDFVTETAWRLINETT
ncbi:MAG: hypothetical protein LBU36_05450 [Clostridiales bacterium]|jgi:hydroxymethylpyrimidine pyrophosphatase-like HAD family hydrolase|nr:hypothetical protein [Clostridiales bacterium]